MNHRNINELKAKISNAKSVSPRQRTASRAWLAIGAGLCIFAFLAWKAVPTAGLVDNLASVSAASNVGAAVQSLQKPEPEFVPDPARQYTAVGQAIAYMDGWYCPTGNVHGTVIDVTDWLKEMDRLTPEHRARYSIDNGGCAIWTP